MTETMSACRESTCCEPELFDFHSDPVAYAEAQDCHGAIITTASPLPNGQVGVHYSQTLAGAGGIAPYSYTFVSGTLPPGLMFTSGGVVDGDLTMAGIYRFTVLLTDSTP